MEPNPTPEAAFWRRIDETTVECMVCPHRCRLAEGQRGRCFAREARGGRVVLGTYGRVSSVADDPIEKKPLFHFLPGTRTLSIGSIGCNLACRFCQNASISKPRDLRALRATLTPDEVARLAIRSDCPSVAFTYNEPVVSLEWVRDTALACRAHGLRTVAVTAGYVDGAARRAFFGVMDAANVDLKAIRDGFYRRLCGARIAPVLDTLRYLREETEVWLEVTQLVVPGDNSSDEDLAASAAWCVAHLGPDTPLHFSAFFPTFRLMDRPPTDPRLLEHARALAREAGARHVYLGNLDTPGGADTRCAACGAVLIRRDGFAAAEERIAADGRCPDCGAVCPGVFRSPGSAGPRQD